MGMSAVVVYALGTIAGTIVVAALVHLVWRAVGVYRIRRAGPRRLLASDHLLWRRSTSPTVRAAQMAPPHLRFDLSRSSSAARNLACRFTTLTIAAGV